MSNEHFFERIKTCEAKYDDKKNVRYVIFSTTNGQFLGVVVYIYRQLKNGGDDSTMDVKHFPADTEKNAIDSCETWIKDNINNQISVNCVEG